MHNLPMLTDYYYFCLITTSAMTLLMGVFQLGIKGPAKLSMLRASEVSNLGPQDVKAL
jgi:hypothetical protein